MAKCEDRPVSMYDNLNTTNTPPASPYADVSFKHATKSPSNSHTEGIPASSPNNKHLNNYEYSQVNKTPNQTNRPLSQPPDANGYSSLAAVKAALHDAKSKFFGLNGSTPTNNISKSHQEPLLPTNNLLPSDQREQIVPKSQPKYQNIPENSAIFRNAHEAVAPDSPEIQVANIPESSPARQHKQLKDSPNSVQYLTIPRKPIGPDMEFAVAAQPSQAVYMSTTVPQNMKGSKIAGRHTPTRNSLRHSRMLVVNKSYQGSGYQNPMGFKFPKLTRTLLILKMIIGILITLLGTWILILDHHANIEDVPYWSGLALILSAAIGFVLIRFNRINGNKFREQCFAFMKWNSYILSILSVLLCVIAFTFAAVHLGRLLHPHVKCSNADQVDDHIGCQCTSLPNNLDSNSTLSDLNLNSNNYSFHYRNLSCNEVTGVWITLLECSIALNCLAFAIAIIYLMLLVFCRDKEVYTTVQTSAF